MPSDERAPHKLEARFRRFLADLDHGEGGVAGHSMAVCKTAFRLAEAIVPGDEVRSITLGALVHDIGKVFVDPAVLGKEAPLTEAELATVRLHPLLGEALLSPSFPDETVLGIVRWHHERWDGGGYPDGLAATATPIGARIVATADAFVAMRETRAYRPARRRDDAVDELQRLSGRQFDPECVHALVETLASAQEREVA